eukprot:3554979-Rhodomonas_salina.1
MAQFPDDSTEYRGLGPSANASTGHGGSTMSICSISSFFPERRERRPEESVWKWQRRASAKPARTGEVEHRKTRKSEKETDRQTEQRDCG